MLEERLSSAYSQHNIGPYGTAPPGQQTYDSYPPLSKIASEGRAGAENYYLSNAVPNQFHPSQQPQQRQRTGSSYATNHNPYPTLNASLGDVPHQPWNQSDTNTLRSHGPVHANAYPARPAAPPGPSNFYTGPGQPSHEASHIASTLHREGETPYQQAPILRRDSQYQQSATTPSAFASPPQPAPSNLPPQSTYPQQDVGSGLSNPPELTSPQFSQPPQGPQSYYFQPPSQTGASQAYPGPPVMDESFSSYPPSQPGSTYASHSQYQTPTPQKAVAEESLIEL
jgi:growth factor-regulated tyrosine kinase substrate